MDCASPCARALLRLNPALSARALHGAVAVESPGDSPASHRGPRSYFLHHLQYCSRRGQLVRVRDGRSAGNSASTTRTERFRTLWLCCHARPRTPASSPKNRAASKNHARPKVQDGSRIVQIRNRPGPIWQRSYFDFICRRTRDFSNKLDYIHQNPKAAGLVERPEDWRWSSYRHYAKLGAVSRFPDFIDFSADPNELLWPAPCRPQ
jgi:hypothetical protein